MSVQVRRRREAAAFLASFVGAQGELLVDTTNNRVQVHDGVTPGGWPAARCADLPGFNLGINTNGAVNQRGVSGTVTLSAGQYGHDRHKGGAAGCTYTFATAANGDTTFTITAGSLIQAIDAGNVWSGAMWLTWTGTAGARVYQGGTAPAYSGGAAVPLDGTTVNAVAISGLALGTITTVEFGTGTLNTTRPWQLEAALPNAGPTRLGRRHGELALCQRYAYVFNDVSNTGGVAQTSSSVFCRFVFPVAMRAVPTIAVLSSGSFSVSDDYSGNFFVTNPTIMYATANTLSTRFAVNNFSSGTFVQGRYYASALSDTALFLASAEI